MAINVQYGPISTAIALAEKGGNGVRVQRQQQIDQQFIAQVRAQEAAQDRAYANTISQALSADNQAATAGLRAGDIYADNARADRQLAAQQQTNNARLQGDEQQRAIAQQNANTAAQNAATGQNFGQQRIDLATEKYQNPIQKPANAGAKLTADWNRLRVALGVADQLAKSNSEDTKDDFGDPVRGGARVPLKGREQAYNTAVQKRDSILAEMEQLGLQAGSVAGGEGVIPGEDSVDIQPQTQQPAPQQGSGGIPVINTMQEYAQLPSGAKYIDAQTGKLGQKP